jgi:hypothetical protein
VIGRLFNLVAIPCALFMFLLYASFIAAAWAAPFWLWFSTMFLGAAECHYPGCQ